MMDTQSQKTFEAIIAKGVHELTVEDIGFLRARRDYLSDQDRKKFASILDVKKVEVKEPEAPKSDLKRPALMKEAKKLGLTFDKSVTAPQLKAMIDNAKFDLEAEKEVADEKAEIRKALEEKAKSLKIGFGSDITDEELRKLIDEAQGEDPEVSEEE